VAAAPRSDYDCAPRTGAEGDPVQNEIETASTLDIREREILDYALFGDAVRDLATAVHESGYRPDWVVAIARGGLIIGGAIAYALGHKNIATVNVEFYTDVDERLDVPVELPPVLDLDDIANRSILIVDDVADTGETLRLVVEKCRPAVADLRSLVQCDYVWKRTDRWINFPWSTLPPVNSDIEAP
jgi:hypoxanthine phosphoribosyltransferase